MFLDSLTLFWWVDYRRQNYASREWNSLFLLRKEGKKTLNNTKGWIKRCLENIILRFSKSFCSCKNQRLEWSQFKGWSLGAATPREGFAWACARYFTFPSMPHTFSDERVVCMLTLLLHFILASVAHCCDSMLGLRGVTWHISVFMTTLGWCGCYPRVAVRVLVGDTERAEWDTKREQFLRRGKLNFPKGKNGMISTKIGTLWGTVGDERRISHGLHLKVRTWNDSLERKSPGEVDIVR